MKKPLIALGLLAVHEHQPQHSQSRLTDDFTAALNAQCFHLQARRALAVSQVLPRFVTVNKSFEKGGI